MPKEKLTAREVKARLGKNTSKTPLNLFDAEPYVHYQRQLYYAIVCSETVFLKFLSYLEIRL